MFRCNIYLSAIIDITNDFIEYDKYIYSKHTLKVLIVSDFITFLVVTDEQCNCTYSNTNSTPYAAVLYSLQYYYSITVYSERIVYYTNLLYTLIHNTYNIQTFSGLS